VTQHTDNKNIDVTMPPWLQGAWGSLEEMLGRRQLPQALLIHGPTGTGRRYLGTWLAARCLGVPGPRSVATDLVRSDTEFEPAISHPDFLAVSVPTEKSAIGIEQVRALIGFLQLTSHKDGNRVVMLAPAEAMTPSAANSLLKTLEEPPPFSVIILVAEAAGQLPATIVSRCHRLRVAVPERQVALDWLRTVDAEGDWDLLLDFALGLPLCALDLHERGFASRAGQYRDVLRQLLRGRASPTAAAKEWAADDDWDLLLRWLYGEMAGIISRSALAGSSSRPVVRARGEPLQNDRKPLNMRSLYARLREVEGLCRSRGKAINMELQLATLLERWQVDMTDATRG
jgi:DNA polymerase-3 subunit delta'